MTRKAYTKPAATETPLKQLLGHGQIVTHKDYTPAVLQTLCELHTMAVLRLQEYTRKHYPRTYLQEDVLKLRGQADFLNERIDSDCYGGTGGTGEAYPFSDLPPVCRRRAELDLAAKRALNALTTKEPIGHAHGIVKAALLQLENEGVDTEEEL